MLGLRYLSPIISLMMSSQTTPAPLVMLDIHTKLLVILKICTSIQGSNDSKGIRDF